MPHPVVEIREPGRPPWRMIVRDTVDMGRACKGVNLADLEVSRRHLTFTYRDGSLTVRDHRSTNGTTVNGAPVTAETRLAPGDVVALGQVTVVVLPPDDPG